MKIKYLAGQMLCLFLCTVISAYAAPAPDSIPESTSQICAGDVECTTDNVPDNHTVSDAAPTDCTETNNTPITVSEPKTEQKTEVSDTETPITEVPKPVQDNTDDKPSTIKDSDETSDAEAISIDDSSHSDRKDEKADTSADDLNTDKEQAGIQTEDKSDGKPQTGQVKNTVYVKSADASNTAKAATKPVVQSSGGSVKSTQATTKKATATSVSATPMSVERKISTADVEEKPAARTTTGTTAGTTAKTTTASTSTSTSTKSKPLTPDGQGTVVDEATDEDGKEFYTITTPNENVFYLVIDKQRDDKNVYFLNAVTESDLMRLAEKDKETSDEEKEPAEEQKHICYCTRKCKAGEVDTACPVCVLNFNDCSGVEAKPVSESDLPKKSGNGFGTWLLILLAAMAAGGAGYYFKIYKPKHDLDDAEDFDELTGMEEEETVNEDDEPDYGEEISYGPEIPEKSSRGGDEPDEPDNTDRYGDEPEEPEYYED